MASCADSGMSMEIAPAFFGSDKAKLFFNRNVEEKPYGAIFLSELSYGKLVEFFNPICPNYIDGRCAPFGFKDYFGTLEVCKLCRVYLFSDDIRALLIALGKYCRFALDGCPFTRVSDMSQLGAPDLFVGFGFEDRGTPESDCPRPEPFSLFDLSNLGRIKDHIESRFYYNPFNAVCRVGYGSLAKFGSLRDIANTAVFS